VARGLLALSAIPMSISLLRFLSFFQHLGQLVIMIFAMSRDLVSFLVVFLISILGFGIAFHSLFPDTSAFSGPGATFLTLFNAALGGHEFETYEGHKYQNLGM
jgi:Ion transport protein